MAFICFVSNFKKKGIDIDFAILWGYDNGKKAFNIQLLDDHRI